MQRQIPTMTPLHLFQLQTQRRKSPNTPILCTFLQPLRQGCAIADPEGYLLVLNVSGCPADTPSQISRYLAPLPVSLLGSYVKRPQNFIC